MPKLSTSVPKYRKHRASGEAVVTINGREHYLGPHGTKASKLEYDRLINQWLVTGRDDSFGLPEHEKRALSGLMSGTSPSWLAKARLLEASGSKCQSHLQRSNSPVVGRYIFFPKDIPKRVASVVGAIVARRSISSVAPCCWTGLRSSYRPKRCISILSNGN